MVQSFSKVMIHFIFATDDRYPYLTPDVEKDLYPYLSGILHHLESPPVRINGGTEHIHILCLLSRTISISRLVEEVKTGSSKWIKGKGGILTKFAWQTGYSAFSVSQSKENAVVRYIENQKEHHRLVSFLDEYKKFLDEYGVVYDPKYLR